MIDVAAFYRFTPLPDPAALRAPLARLGCGAGVRGSILLAPEGVNGTIAGPPEGVAAVLDHLRGLPGCADLTPRMSHTETMPFGRLKVRLKREIVTMGRPEADPTRAVGTYVAPADWNALISAPDVAVIDTRNGYEVEAGSFAGAIDPGTDSFGAFPDWWQANRDSLAGKRIAMFCTGGIRCEKATSYLRSQGVDEVFHLQGGILGYLETVPEADSLWQGECFVFDDRVSVTHGLIPGTLGLCHGCRRPLTEAERQGPDYEEGVSCSACAADLTPARRERLRERQLQIRLARDRGTRHLGA
ncbi:rhodanese-related sulfurtransferase [Mesobaculum littorinae]|uniref:tRNA uridine(34) hydroxylase n=1 Tax=Mesobaculum littorinae TaxID=2486419 RepID=A0A438AHI8_9RHOB|nr:rhodanese-related sulfurtransferase [Mesobaculum littorinae]RVV98138.1 rhodanese-related sulfurtransferase [Mesobaculum littorinae]